MSLSLDSKAKPMGISAGHNCQGTQVSSSSSSIIIMQQIFCQSVSQCLVSCVVQKDAQRKKSNPFSRCFIREVIETRHAYRQTCRQTHRTHSNRRCSQYRQPRVDIQIASSSDGETADRQTALARCLELAKYTFPAFYLRDVLAKDLQICAEPS